MAVNRRSSPHLDALTILCDDVRAGRRTPDELAETLAYVTGEMEEARNAFQAGARQEGQSAATAAQVPVVEAAFDRHRLGLEDIGRYLEDPDPLHFERGIRHIHDATDALHQAFDVLDAETALAMFPPCMACGHREPPGPTHCSQCGAKRLIQPGTALASAGLSIQEGVPSGVYVEYTMTTNLQRLLEAANAIAEGRTTSAQFQETLQWMRRTIADSRTESAALAGNVAATPEGSVERQTLDLLHDGLDQFDAALDRMAQYMTDPDIDHLIIGYKMALDASLPLLAIEKAQEEVKIGAKGHPGHPPAEGAGGPLA